MAKEKKDTNNKKTTRKKTSKKKKKSNKGPRIIWLYGAHPSVVKATLRKIADYGSKESIKLRKSLGLTLNHVIIPIYAYPAKGRDKTVKQLSEIVTDAVFIVMGLSVDKKNKKTQKLYKDTEAAWIHPRERDFHIAMMRESDSKTFKEAEKDLAEFKEYSSEHFNKEDIHII